MTTLQKVSYLILSILGIFFVPYAGAWIHYQGNFPPDYFAFPALTAPAKAGFNLIIFIIVSIIFGVTLLVYLFPSFFGFQKIPSSNPSAPPKVPKNLPIWFWMGFLMWGIAFIALAGKFSTPKWLINWAVIPLYWGFTAMLDGWVYVRTSGKSLISQAPQKLIAIGVASISGWMIFEYLNFFVLDNWTYNKGDSISGAEFMLYAILGSSGLMPMVYEWYYLLRTYDWILVRFQQGKALTMPLWMKIGILIGCYVGLWFCPFYPNAFFVVLWYAPLLILSIVLSLLDIWTPWTPLKKGNWTATALIALSFLIQGFLCESWNYMSGTHENGKLINTFNPDYWEYHVPYVDVLHVFEMPLLGFAGYLPFGVYCAVWWSTFTFLLNIPVDLQEE